MSSTRLALPPHVVLRDRASGPIAMFLLNKRDRPEGFTASAVLPFNGPRQPIDDPAILRAIRKDARDLNARLTEARAALLIGGHHKGSWQAAMWLWKRSQAYVALSPNTKRTYANGERWIKPFMNALGSDQLSAVTPKAIGLFVDGDQLSDAARRAFLNVLGNIIGFALEEGWIATNPIANVRKRRGTFSMKTAYKVDVTLWDQSGIEAYEAAALSLGWIGGAIMVRGMWDSMARMYDTAIWTRDHWDMQTGILSYVTGKTNRPAYAAMSLRFAELLTMTNGNQLITRPNGDAYSRDHMNAQMQYDQQALHAAVVASGGRQLVLRHIRHSAITDAASRGLSPEQLRANTSHADARITNARYIKQSQDQAVRIGVARGITALTD